MTDQSASSHLQVLFEAALQDYEKKTGIALAEHPLADRLQNCDSVESVTAVFHEQTQAFSEFRGKDKVLKPLKKAVSILCKLSATANFGQNIGLVRPSALTRCSGSDPHPIAFPTREGDTHRSRCPTLCMCILQSTSAHFCDIQTYQGVKGTLDSYDALVDVFELIDHFLIRLDIYTKIPPRVGMTDIFVKILVELLSTLALATKQIKERKPSKSVLREVLYYLTQRNAVKILKKLLGDKDVEAVLQRLDRLTLDEARITGAYTLELVYGLIQNMNLKVVMDGEQFYKLVACSTLRIVFPRRQVIGRASKGCRYVFRTTIK
jgi:hypothetical protein